MKREKKEHRKEYRKRKRKTVRIAGAVCIIAAAAAAGIVLWGNYEKTKGIVFFVEDEPVYQEEVRLAADQTALAVEQEFAEKTGQELGKTDFSLTADGRTGYKYLAEAVEERLVAIKTLEIDARKNGLCEEIDYPAVERARQEENEKRAADKAADQVVYGVMSFSEEEYFSYFIANLNLQNERYLINKGVFTAEESEIRKFYDKDPTAFDEQPYESVEIYVENALLSQKYEAYMGELSQNAETEGEENLEDCLKKLGY